MKIKQSVLVLLLCLFPFTGYAIDFGNVNILGELNTTDSRLTKGWFVDLTVTNPIDGAVTGNAGTVTDGVYTTDFPLNQNTTGSAATLTAPRAIAGVDFDGSAAAHIGVDDNADAIAIVIGSDESVTLNAGQVNYPDTQNPSADANTLDDYEEGIYTAVVTCSSSGGMSLSSSFDSLSYVKIGSIVFLQGGLSRSADDSCSGNVRISLPFETATLAESQASFQTNLWVAGHSGTFNQIHARIGPGLSYFDMLYLKEDGTNNFMTHSNINVNWSMAVNFSYRAAN